MKKQFLFTSLLLCVSVPLWFKTTIAQEKLPPETEAKIRAVLESSPLKGAHVGLSILDLGAVKNAQAFPAQRFVGKPFRVLFEHDADKKFMPASNMKLFTAAIALELLGKDKTFPTRVIICDSLVDGTVRELYLTGGGDPALTTDHLRELADKVAAYGVTRVSSDVMASGAVFTAETFDGRYPSGWTLDDALWYYGPEISALAINRNQVDLSITGGNNQGDPVSIVLEPAYNFDPLEGPDIQAFVVTGEADSAGKSADGLVLDNRLRFERGVARGDVITDQLVVSGQVAPKQKSVQGVALPRPAYVAATVFKKQLHSAGVQVEGAGWDAELGLFACKQETMIAQHNSPPLKVLFQRLLKNSDNLYAEMLLRDAAYYYDKTGGDKAGPRAHALLKKWLISQNIDTTDLRFEDCSGLSRYNLLTPRATAELLAAINRMKDGDVIWNALPIAGIDGTMKKRLASTPGRSNLATGNVRAKSGTFSIASNLSGYVTTRADSSGVRHRLAVSIYMNFPRDTDSAQAAQDKIFAILANSR